MQSTDQLSCCNPTSSRAQISSRVDPQLILNRQNANYESDQSRRSMDEEDERLTESMRHAQMLRQQQTNGSLGDIRLSCCCCAEPASDLRSAAQPKLRQRSFGSSFGFNQTDTTPQSPNSKLRDEVIAAINGQNCKERRSSWERDPTPLKDWSVEEQRALITALNSIPRDLRNDSDHRHLVFCDLIRPHKPLDGKKLSECEECYEHIKANRIAYFGPIQQKRTIYHGNSPDVRPER